MSLREEIELQDRRILTQLGIPPELIYGGMTWSGSNVSLRMLENMFLYYINKQNTFLEFFVNYVARMSEKQAPSGVRLKQFKMADDVQQIQMRSNLGLQNRISETTALSPMDIDLEAEAQQAEDEAPLVQRINKARQMNVAKAGLDVSKETNQAQVDIQANTQLHQNDVQGTMSLTDGFIATTARGYVNKLNAMPPDQRAAELRALQAQDPAKFNEVVSALYGAAEQAPVAPLPEQRAPRSGPGGAQI